MYYSSTCIAFFLFALFSTFPVQAQNLTLPEVIGYKVEKQNWVEKKEALGTLRANESVIVTTNVNETVTEILFESGDHVEKNQIILLFDQNEEEASLRAAKSRLKERERAYERAKNLKKNDFTSKAVLEERLANLEETKAEIAIIESRIKDRTIRAPFSGILGLRDISIGSYIEANDTITTLDDISVMKLDFNLPEIYLPFIRINLKIDAYSSALKKSFSGIVQSIDSRIDPVTRSIKLRALIDNPDYLLKPGMLMRVEILKEPEQAITIPEETLLMKGTQRYVFVLSPTDDDDIYTVKQQPIETGIRQNGMVKIISGLNAGDLLVAHGIQKVANDTRVKLIGLQSNEKPAAEFFNTHDTAPQ